MKHWPSLHKLQLPQTHFWRSRLTIFLTHGIIGCLITLLITSSITSSITSNTTSRIPAIGLPAQAQTAPPNPSLDIVAPVASDRVMELEQSWGSQYDEYFAQGRDRLPLSPAQISQRLAELSATSGKNAALIYTVATPNALELIVILPSGSVIRRTVRDAIPFRIARTIRELHRDLTIRYTLQSPDALQSAQRLYQWLIAPIDPILSTAHIDVLLFCAGPGLRTLPFAALYDGQHFLTERYGVVLIPAFNLIDTQYTPLQNAPILAMGASEFETLDDLPGVPSELEAIAQLDWPTTIAINPTFTLNNLTTHLQEDPFKVVHLATHAQFLPGYANQSFIQLWNQETLSLAQLDQLPWNDADVELLVLSACQTAIGDRQAELGFAGVAYQAGVNSVLASLWRVSDLGTFVLMREFYTQLTNPTVHTKVDALRRAQQNLLERRVYIKAGQLYSPSGVVEVPTIFGQNFDADFTNPYYWSAFTLIGSPW